MKGITMVAKTKKPAVKKEPDTGILYITGIPAKLKRQFKACCVSKDISMTDAVIQFMERTVANERRVEAS